MQNYLIIILFLLGQIISAQTFSNGQFIGKASQPTLMKSGGTAIVMTEEEYTDLLKRIPDNGSFVKIKEKPTKLSVNARFGINLVIDGKNLPWILDGDENRGFRLYADWNADGNLAKEKPVKFAKVGDTYSFKKVITETIGGKTRKYPYQLNLELTKVIPPLGGDKKFALKMFDGTFRDGKISLENREVAFRIFGSSGIYNHDTNSIYFDHNNDGEFDSKTRYSAEYYKVREKYVNIGNQSYEFVVDRYGDTLTLKRLAEAITIRTDLSEGSPAPDFSFKTIGGKSYKLSDFRGKVVLLDVWGLWCAPCIAEAPALAVAYQRLKDKGFEIIGLDVGDKVENLQKFIAQKQMNWIHTQTDDAFINLYRIDSYPSYFLIDKDGKIISNSIRAGEGMYRKIEELLKSQN